MYRNFLKVAWRSFMSQKYYSAINTIGLALGIAACILILLFIQDELSYEQGFKNEGKIFRMVQDFPMGEHLSQSATVPFPVKGNMLEDFPEITNAAWIFRPGSWGNNAVIKYGDKEFFEDDFIFAEHSFLEIYDFKFIKGDAKTALTNANELLITESTAKKYFGDEDPIGKTLNMNNFRDLEIVAVIEDLSQNTHLQFDMMASFATYLSFFNNQARFDEGWVWVAAWMYFTVDNEAEVAKIREQIPAFVKNHYPAVLADKGVALYIQDANDIHLTSNRELEFKANGNIRHVYLFTSIAILILIIAIINFMNLATSRSTKRAKEVGIRKVVGSQRGLLIFQFMGEAVLTSFLSLIVAVILIFLALPWFNVITGKNFNIDLLNNTTLIGGMFLLSGIVGLLAGIYPALILSSFKPVDVINGRSVGASSSSALRKILVVVQFVVTITLIISIGIVNKQLNYIEGKNLGFDQEQIVTADIDFRQFDKYPSFKNEVLRNPEIIAVSMLGGSIPGDEAIVENSFRPNGTPVEEEQFFSVMNADYGFEKIINMEFIEGHSFEPGSSVDSAGYIINEAAALALGWEGEVVGRLLNRGNRSGQVIGLVKDFNYRPLYDPVKPLVIRRGGGKMLIKFKTDDISGTLANLTDEWQTQFGGFPFRYSFMDDNFAALYVKESRFSTTIQAFSVLAVLIACLGLLGLSSHATERRKKEIGIRKVNGASSLRLVSLLSKDFSKLILISFVLSIPVAYYFGNLWLDNFAYKVDIGVNIYAIAGVIALTLALLTVSFHTLRAARSNPVDSLRYE
jgi:putative ABC transport system permease protein